MYVVICFSTFEPHSSTLSSTSSFTRILTLLPSLTQLKTLVRFPHHITSLTSIRPKTYHLTYTSPLTASRNVDGSFSGRFMFFTRFWRCIGPRVDLGMSWHVVVIPPTFVFPFISLFLLCLSSHFLFLLSWSLIADRYCPISTPFNLPSCSLS
ncbi:hypothetical protein BJ165DRAFT_932887 [Panaeolus papilionaceus]|nr:hypothetical protein BJ165DRAFT_932887 [Panaeolus papilionaceus]